MDRRKFLGALSAAGLAPFFRAGLGVGTLTAAAPSYAANRMRAKPLIRVSWESSRGPMLFDHSYHPVPGTNPRSHANFVLKDFIQWNMIEPRAAKSAEGGSRIVGQPSNTPLTQPKLNRRVETFVQGADVFIGLIWLGQANCKQDQFLAAAAAATRNHVSPRIAVTRGPFAFEGRKHYRYAQLQLDKIRSMFDVVKEMDADKIIDPYGDLTLRDAYDALGSYEMHYIATLCAKFSGYDSATDWQSLTSILLTDQ